MSRTESTYAGLSRIQLPALIVGAIGLALCALGAYLSPDQFFPSYLFACLFWLGVSLGSLAIVMLYHLAGGAWGFVVLRVMETAAMLLPLMALLFVPLFFGLSVLYPWARPASVAGDPVLQHKSAYLDPLFFTVRVAVYFAIWIGMAYLLNRWSFEQDRTDDPALAVIAHYALGTTWLWRGALPAARQHLEAGIAHYTPDQRRAPAFRIGHDPGVACRAFAAWTLWLLG